MPDFNRYASVTSIVGLLPKELTWWAGNAVADCAFNKQEEWRDLPTRDERYEYVRRAHQRLKDHSADLGSEIHSAVEARNLGKPSPPYPLHLKPRMQQFEAFLLDWKLNVIAAECKVYKRGTHPYAGTVDMIVEFPDGRTAIIDVKTGKNVWPEAVLQINAYAHADFLIADPHHPGARQVNKRGQRRYYTWSGPEEDEIKMPHINTGYVLHLREDGYDMFECHVNDEYQCMFESLFAVFEWETDLKKRAFK